MALQARTRAVDCNANGVADALDIANDTSADCNVNGSPDECDVRRGEVRLDFGGSYPSARGPTELAPADLDGDGDADIVATNADSQRLAVLLNDGDGTLDPAFQPAVTWQTIHVAAADIDGDGRGDIALVSYLERSGELSVQRGQPDGSIAPFGTAKEVSPGDLLATDLDGDQDIDLTVTGGHRIQWFVNRGDGSFDEPVHLDASAATGDYAVTGDLSGDGRPDFLITAGSEAVVVALQADGAAPGLVSQYLETPVQVRPLALLDADADGDLDAVAASGDFNYSKLFLLLNDGAGKMGLDGTFAVARPPVDLATADLDGDGFTDLVLTLNVGQPGQPEGAIELRPGAGTGRIGEPATFARGGIAEDLALVDLTGDGRVDAVVADPATNSVTVILNRHALGASNCDGDDVPDACEPDCDRDGRPDGCEIAAGDAADIDEDGIPDACEADCDRDGIPDHDAIARGLAPDCNHNGTPDPCDLTMQVAFDGPTRVQAGLRPWGLRAGDLDGDARPDLAVINVDSHDLSVVHNDGERRFAPPVRLPFGGRGVDLYLEDIDGDGHLDVIARDEANTGVGYSRGRGERRFLLPQRLALGTGRFEFVVADIDGDGNADLVVVIDQPGTRTLCYPGRDDGSFGEPVPLPDLGTPGRLGAAELTGDGKPDLFAGTSYWANLGGFVFAPPRPTHAGGIPADIDADGDLDFIECISESVLAARQDGKGNFAQPVHSDVGLAAVVHAAGDLDGDGWADLIAVRDGYHMVALRGIRDGKFAPWWLRSGGIFGTSVADFDGDSHLDVAMIDDWAQAASIYWNDGAGLLSSPREYLSLDVAGIHAADMDGDADPEILTIGFAGAALHVNAGGGDLGPPQRLGTLQNVRSATISEFAGDGAPDVALIDGDERVVLFQSFGPLDLDVIRVFAEGNHPSEVLGADVDVDGDLDLLAVHSQGWSVFRNRGGADFAPGEPLVGLPAIGRPHPGDIDRDGDLDFLGVSAQPPQFQPRLSVLRRGADGAYTFEAGPLAPENFAGIAVADFTGDGLPEAAIGGSSAAFTYSNDGAGGFRLEDELDIVGGNGRWIAAADMDRDGSADLLLKGPGSTGADDIRWHRNDGQGRFASGQGLGLYRVVDAALAVDMELDGDPDLATGTGVNQGLAIAFNRSRAASADGNGDGVPDDCQATPAFRRGDADGDGLLAINDAVLPLRFLFLGDATLPCELAADADDSGDLGINDVAVILRHLFLDAAPLPPPGPPPGPCGVDPTPGTGGLPCLIGPPCP